MKIFGVDPVKDVNWYFIWYTVTAIAFVVLGTQNLAATGTTTAVIFAIGASITLINFGLRWFGQTTNRPRVWPPVINMCPDYLTYVPSLPGCIDMLGITNKAAGLLRTLPTEVNNVKLGNTNKVFEFTSKDVKSADSINALQAICDRCKNAGVTWEGVYDGDTCISITSQAIRGAGGLSNRCLIDTDEIMGTANFLKAGMVGSGLINSN